MPRKTARPAPPTGAIGPRGYLFTITLRDVRPPVWRRIRVGDVTLDALHAAIQAAMGWDERHRYFFRIGDAWYGRPGRLDDQPFAAELRDSAAPLAQIAQCCGFYDQAMFCRQFRQATGLTPSQYREVFARAGALPG